MKWLLIDSSATSTSTPRVLPSANSIPEMNHNEIEAYGSANSARMQDFVVVLLRDADDHERIAAQIRHREENRRERRGRRHRSSLAGNQPTRSHVLRS